MTELPVLDVQLDRRFLYLVVRYADIHCLAGVLESCCSISDVDVPSRASGLSLLVGRISLEARRSSPVPWRTSSAASAFPDSSLGNR